MVTGWNECGYFYRTRQGDYSDCRLLHNIPPKLSAFKQRHLIMLMDARSWEFINSRGKISDLSSTSIRTQLRLLRHLWVTHGWGWNQPETSLTACHLACCLGSWAQAWLLTGPLTLGLSTWQRLLTAQWQVSKEGWRERLPSQPFQRAGQKLYHLFWPSPRGYAGLFLLQPLYSKHTPKAAQMQREGSNLHLYWGSGKGHIAAENVGREILSWPSLEKTASRRDQWDISQDEALLSRDTELSMIGELLLHR